MSKFLSYSYDYAISFEYAIPIKPTSTNNQAEYQAILKGIQLLHEVKAESIEVFGDSQLVINICSAYMSVRMMS
jgi:ribonuclease HI